MNDLKELWKENGNGTDMLQQMLQSKSFKKQGLHSPLAKLKRNLTIHLVYAVVITIAYALLIYYFPIWQVQACMLLLIVFNLWAMNKAWALYQQVEVSLNDTNVLTALKKVHQMFTEWEKQSLRAALWVYPFAATGGFMLGGTVGSEKTVEVFMSDNRVLIALVIMLVVLVPLSYWLAKWMTRVAFGKYVQQIKERIDELEALE
jgi:hypothetical protein